MSRQTRSRSHTVTRRLPDQPRLRIWITRGSRRKWIEFEWLDGYTSGPVTLTESFGSVRLDAPSAAGEQFLRDRDARCLTVYRC